MASLQKSLRREKAKHKAKHGMKISNKGIFTIVAAIGNKTKKSIVSELTED